MGIVAAIVGAAVSSFGLGGIIAGTTIFGLNAFGSFLVRAAIGIALNALSPKPKTPNIGDPRTRGYNVNQRGSALDHQIIYGRARVGGAIIFRGTTGTNNKFLHEVIAYTGHEIESFDEIYINDERVTGQDTDGFVTEVTAPDGSTSDRYASFIRISEHLGTADQTADPDLVAEVAEWTNDHRLRGCSYLYIRYAFDGDVFPNGVPQVTATIKGKKVYDPRSDTTAWSDNPALCLRDYLTNGYGLDEADANIDDDLVEDAANICDDIYTDAGTTRYTCNGNFTTQDTPYDTLNDLLTCMGGLLWYAQGKWRMKPAYWTEPTVEFTEDDLRSSVSVKTRHSRRDNFNTVKGTFRGEETDWQVTDYPEVTNQAFIDADNGQESVVDIELPFTDNSIEARRISRIILERNRQQLTVTAAFGLRAFQVQVGDNIQLSIDRFGWSQKEFEVVAWTFGLSDGKALQVQMTLREISESVFDEVDDGIVYERDNTSLLSAFEVPNVGLSAVATTRVIREKLTNVITVNVTSSRPEAVDLVEVQFKQCADDTWISLGTGELGEFEAVDLVDCTYSFRARAINTFGVKGEYATLTGIQAEGLSQPPADVTGFTAEVNGGLITLEWEPVADLDLSYYRIRHSLEESGATWSNATTAVDKVPRPGTSVTVPARPGTYHIRAVDKTGVPSVNYTSVVVPEADLEDFSSVLTQTEDPTFTGSKTDCFVESGGLRIGALELFDDLSGLIDSLSGNWDDLGQLEIKNTGTYDFSDYIDTGSVRRVRTRIDLENERVDYTSDLFDNLAGDFDQLAGLFDDLTGNPQFADTDVKTYISITQDDPAGSPTWTDYKLFKAGDFSGRAFRYRVILSATTDDVTPSITALEARVEYN